MQINKESNFRIKLPNDELRHPVDTKTKAEFEFIGEKLIAIRGVTTIEADSKEEIEKASIELFGEIMSVNGLEEESLVSLQITTTEDIRAYYPATALRLNGCKIPLFSSLEPSIKNSMPKCIRYLVLAYSSEKASHVYLKGAKDLIKRDCC